MERRPPNNRVQNQAGHNSAKMKDAKESYAKNEQAQGKVSHHDSHEAQSNEAFLERMNEKLKKSGEKKTDSP